MIDFSKIRVHCDEQADAELFNRIKVFSKILKNISRNNVTLYPQMASNKGQNFKNIEPLCKDDRPDYIITYEEKPILVLEITEHAYTGDNGLQRFGRVASSAENGVSFIYFGPLARVRDDELDLAEDPSELSARSLTSDFFEGMLALHNKFGTLQLYSEWKTASNGKVLKVRPEEEDRKFLDVYGHLISLISAIIVSQIGEPQSKIDACRFLDGEQNKLHVLAKNKNTIFSDVKMKITKERLFELLQEPSRLVKELDGYFNKGKPQKSIALYSLKNSSVNKIVLKDNIVEDTSQIYAIITKLSKLSMFDKGAFIYYSGYKWRSDPHCGVAVNLYYRESQNHDYLPLVLYYPRVSISKDRTEKLLKDVFETDKVKQLFIERYGSEGIRKYNETIKTRSLYGNWITTSKQGRIFYEYCALIICNDGIIIGQSLDALL